MAEVTVTINGRTYKMSCDDGQERHLIRLSEQVNGYVEQMKEVVGQVGDTRLLLMAAIMIADQLGEAKRQAENLRTELERLRDDGEAHAQQWEEAQSSLANVLEEAAGRIEALSRDVGERP